jgi:hypothetical protein
MKVISLDEAKDRLPAIFQEALSGEIIRFKSPTGAELELTPVREMPARLEFSAEELSKSYDDRDWAEFENHCGKASD